MGQSRPARLCGRHGVLGGSDNTLPHGSAGHRLSRPISTEARRKPESASQTGSCSPRMAGLCSGCRGRWGVASLRTWPEAPDGVLPGHRRLQRLPGDCWSPQAWQPRTAAWTCCRGYSHSKLTGSRATGHTGQSLTSEPPLELAEALPGSCFFRCRRGGMGSLLSRVSQGSPLPAHRAGPCNTVRYGPSVTGPACCPAGRRAGRMPVG